VSKVRVHELAKELGVTSKEVLAKLQDLGEFVKSASSTVEAPVARRLREAMPPPADKPAAKKTAAKKTAAKKTTATKEPDAPSGATAEAAPVPAASTPTAPTPTAATPTAEKKEGWRPRPHPQHYLQRQGR